MRALLKPILLGAAFILAVTPALAVEGVVMDWAPDSYGWETDYDPVTHFSTAGSELTVVGKIDVFYDPFLDLDPIATEYTFIFEGLISDGTEDWGGGMLYTTYSDGQFAIYEDPSNNADFGENPPNAVSPSTFTDGELILEGILTGFFTWGMPGPGGYAATYEADFEFTGPMGGEFYNRVQGCYGKTGGATSDDPGIGIPAGYSYVVDGHLTVEDCRPIGAEENNWGGVKQLFR